MDLSNDEIIDKVRLKAEKVSCLSCNKFAGKIFIEKVEKESMLAYALPPCKKCGKCNVVGYKNNKRFQILTNEI